MESAKQAEIIVSSPVEMGRVIRSERKAQGMTQAELADLSGAGIVFLSNVENGKATAEIGKVLSVIETLGLDVVLQRRG